MLANETNGTAAVANKTATPSTAEVDDLTSAAAK